MRNWKHRFVCVGIPTTIMRKGLEKVNTGLRTVQYYFLVSDFCSLICIDSFYSQNSLEN